MANPYQGMVSFQQALRAGVLQVYPVLSHSNLYSYVDVPAPGVKRMTYVRLGEDRRTVRAFVSCVMNGYVDGHPCIALGYAVPEGMRNQGLARKIVKDAIKDIIVQIGRAGAKAVYVESVVDVENVSSQRVAEVVLAVERESITDSASGRPAYRYTKRFDTATGR